MNCRQIQTRLSEDSSSRFEEVFEEHLRECQVCRAFCRDLLELEDLAQSLGDQCRVPSEFKTDVLSRVSAHEDSRFPFPPVKSGLIGLFLFAVLVVYFAPWVGAGEQNEELLVLESGRTSVTERYLTEQLPEAPPYVEIVIQDSQDRDLILRLPAEIKIRRTELHEDVDAENITY